MNDCFNNKDFFLFILFFMPIKQKGGPYVDYKTYTHIASIAQWRPITQKMKIATWNLNFASTRLTWTPNLDFFKKLFF